VPTVDLIDETYVVAAPEAVAAAIHDRARWAVWWPGLALTVFMDRGVAGIRWSVAGPLVGSAELWLEPVGDGVVVHYYLRVDLARPVRSPDRVRRRHALAWKQHANRLKDELEGGRPAGEPRVKNKAEGAEEG
jgi:hypothetical protein